MCMKKFEIKEKSPLKCQRGEYYCQFRKCKSFEDYKKI